MLTANQQYTLGVYVGDRADLPLSGYSIELWAGGLLASESSIVPANGTFAPVSVSYTALAGNANLGNALEIRLEGLGSTGQQLSFDLVTLDATAVPEPSTLLLLGTGLLGLAGYRRRNA